MWEPGVKRHSSLDLADILVAELECKSVDVALQMLDLATANDGEDIGSLVHDIRKSDTGDGRFLTLGNLLQRLADLVFRLTGLNSSSLLSIALFLTLELASTQGSPRSKAHAFGLTHGDDISLEVARGSGPTSLIYRELTQPVVSGIFVCFAVCV